MPRQHQRRQCTVCKKWMRSDHLDRHSTTHKLSTLEEKTEEEELEDSELLDEADLLEKSLLSDNQLYLEKIELGRNISTILDKGTIQEESLTKERKLALDLHRRQESRCNISTVQLRPW